MDKRRVVNWYEIRIRGRTWWLVGRYNGRRTRLTLETGDRELATQRAAALWLKVPDLFLEKPVSIDQLASDYLTRRLPRSCNAYRVDQLAGVYKNHIQPRIGTKRVAAVTYSDLLDIRADLSDLKIATVGKIMSFLNALLEYAVKIDVVESHAWGDGLTPKIPKKRPRPYTDEEIDLASSVVSRNAAWAIRGFMLTGLRLAEATTLTPHQFIDVPDRALLIRGKGEKDRMVFLSPEAAAHLDTRRHLDRIWALGRHELTRLGRHTFDRCGIRITPHRLRDTFSCRYLAAGGNMAALQELLGHESIRTTETYGKLTDAMVAADVRRIYGHKSGHAVGEAARK